MNITTLLLTAVLALTFADARADDESEAAAAPAPKLLDLRPPDITDLYTQQHLARLIAKMEADNIEEIEVKGARIPPPTFTPDVWLGTFGATLWGCYIRRNPGASSRRSRQTERATSVTRHSPPTAGSNLSAFRRAILLKNDFHSTCTARITSRRLQLSRHRRL